MRTKLLAMLVLGLMGAISLVEPQDAAANQKSTGQKSTGCALRETATWNPIVPGAPASTKKLAPLRIEARSSGPTCATAEIVLSIQNGAGRILHRDEFNADHVAALYDATTPAKMRAALRTWIDPRLETRFHANLPNWRRGQAEPDAREFPFLPADGMTRDRYMSIKTNRTPVYCYIQGIESINCVVLQGGALVPFGVQTFPG